MITDRFKDWWRTLQRNRTAKKVLRAPDPHKLGDEQIRSDGASPAAIAKVQRARRSDTI